MWPPPARVAFHEIEYVPALIGVALRSSGVGDFGGEPQNYNWCAPSPAQCRPGPVGGALLASLFAALRPIELLIAKLKALLRKAAERSVDGQWNRIACVLNAFAQRIGQLLPQCRIFSILVEIALIAPGRSVTLGVASCAALNNLNVIINIPIVVSANLTFDKLCNQFSKANTDGVARHVIPANLCRIIKRKFSSMRLVPKKRIVAKRPNLLKVLLAIVGGSIAAFTVAQALPPLLGAP